VSNTKKQGSGNPILEAALLYASRGLKVFATTADGKAPSTSNKAWSQRLGKDVPKGKGGLHMATTDEDTVRWMFNQRGAGGVGMPCGKVNNLIVADFDTHKSGEEGRNANARFHEFEDEISATQTVRTRNGGWHVYFAYEPQHGKFELGEGIEVQTDGAYVLLPPSKGYVWGPRVDQEDWETPPWAAVPSQIGLGQSREMISGETPEEVKLLWRQVISGSNWHNAMVRIVAHLVGSGWEDAEIIKHFLAVKWAGYSFEDTYWEVCVACAGAREKWGKERAMEQREISAVNAIKNNIGKLTSRQLADLKEVIEGMLDE